MLWQWFRYRCYAPLRNHARQGKSADGSKILVIALRSEHYSDYDHLLSSFCPCPKSGSLLLFKISFWMRPKWISTGPECFWAIFGGFAQMVTDLHTDWYTDGWTNPLSERQRRTKKTTWFLFRKNCTFLNDKPSCLNCFMFPINPFRLVELLWQLNRV